MVPSHSYLSQDPKGLQDAYDIIIVGSGYGGAVAAARLGQANRKFGLGLRIAVLERGAEWPAGHFPESAEGLAASVRKTEHGKTRNPLGLFDWHSSPDLDAISPSGLGGASLTDPGVMAMPDMRIFDQEGWHDEIRRDIEYGRFEKHFTRAAEVFGRARRPFQVEMARFNEIARGAGLLRGEDEKLGASQVNLDFSISFDETPPESGPQRPPCIHCGACMTGCNAGAMATVHDTYLRMAYEAGVEFFTCVEVRFFEHDRGNFKVHAATHDGNPVDWRASPSLRTISAGMLLVSAGAIGTTELLLRSRIAWKQKKKAAPDLAALGLNAAAASNLLGSNWRLPPLIGKRLGRNGNTLFAVFNSAEVCDTVGLGQAQASAGYTVGPAITSALNTSGPLDPMRDTLYIHDLAVPPAAADALEASLTQASGGLGFGSRLRGLFGGASGRNRSLNKSMLFLTTGHDEHSGAMVFDDSGTLRIRWQRLKETELFKRVKAKAEVLARNLKGQLVLELDGALGVGQRPLGFHTLGGCVMGNDRNSGAVNDIGAVYNASDDDLKAVIPRLFVLGSATIPTSLGTMPALAIAGLAERAADKIAKALVDGELGLNAQSNAV